MLLVWCQWHNRLCIIKYVSCVWNNFAPRVAGFCAVLQAKREVGFGCIYICSQAGCRSVSAHYWEPFVARLGDEHKKPRNARDFGFWQPLREMSLPVSGKKCRHEKVSVLVLLWMALVFVYCYEVVYFYCLITDIGTSITGTIWVPLTLTGALHIVREL